MTRVLLLSAAIIAVNLPVRADEPKTLADEGLRHELQKRVKEDQDARNKMILWIRDNKPEPGKPLPPEVAKAVEEADKANTAWMKEIVDKHGWPTVSLVGKDGAHNAWLLVQHADRDRAFQRKCLDLMKPLVAKNEVSKSDFAYLTDRVLLAEGKKQLYGTQFYQVDGKHVPRPLEDEAKVDERRKEVGLGPLDEYRKQIESMYGPRKKP